MKLEIQIEKRHAYLLIAMAFSLLGGLFAYAFNSGGPNSFIGHSPEELSINSASIVDGSIVNADVNGAAAISGSKLAGSSVTSGQVDSSTVQLRVTGSCSGNNFVQSVGSGGSVGCGPGPSFSGINSCSREIGIQSGGGATRTATCSSGSAIIISPGCFNGAAGVHLIGIHNAGPFNAIDFIWDADPGGGTICDAFCCTNG